MPADTPETSAPRMPYGMLCHRRADVDLEYWEEIWALYAGGEDLLRRPAVLKRLFPQHTAEDPEIYSERRARAGYTNYAGATVDYVVAGLMADPVKPEVKGADASFWEGWVEDLSAPRGKAMSLSELLACHVRNALLFKSAWTLVDLPDVGPELEPRSLGEQEAAGALNVYAKPIDPRCVMDWEQSDDGELEWVLLRFRDVRRSSLMRPRVRVVERFYLYTPGDWTLFLVEYDDPELCKEYRITPEKGYEKPGDDALIDGKSSRHTIGRVPLIHTEIKDGLWMMNKIHSLAKRHFNRENAHDWALLKALFPVLYEFLGPEIPGIDSPVPEQQQDPDRAVKQPRGIGYIQTRGADDDARYVGPETSAFDHALEALKALRDELHRVVYQLALATENSKASVLRSGESKEQDQVALMVLLEELGRTGREFVSELFTLAAAARGGGEVEVIPRGLSKFDRASLTDLVAHVLGLESVSIPSATYQRKVKGRVARRMVGDDCTEEELQAIDSELEESITQDQFQALGLEPPPFGETGEPGADDAAA